MRQLHEAKLARARAVCVWGTGTPRRELLHLDDFAEAARALLKQHLTGVPVNVGTGTCVTMAELAELRKTVMGFAEQLAFGPTKPDGVPRKVLDVSRIRSLGWRPAIKLREDLSDTYRWFATQCAGG